MTLKDILDFDEFMTIARAIGAEPVLVICFNSMYTAATAGGTKPTYDQLLETAVAWVKYANITKGYKIKYWEIGNETYLVDATTAFQYATDLIAFSAAMKAVDPTIKIGANGSGSAWWNTILSLASGSIDWLSVHNYPVWAWESYDFYRTSTPDLVQGVTEAIDSIANYAAVGDRSRLFVGVTETAPIDYSPDFTWPAVNDLGHAIVLFNIIGKLISNPIVHFVQPWVTHWVNNHTPPDVYDLLGSQNQLNPTGQALAIWGQWAGQKMVATTSDEPISAYATYLSGSNKLTIYLINKETSTQPVSVASVQALTSTQFERWVFRGTSPTDLAPTWTQVSDVATANPLLLTLDPTSITVLSEKPAPIDNTGPAPPANFHVQ